MTQKIKVLVVDDSALVRKIITDILESDPDIEVVGTVNNGKTAIYKNDKLNPDVITMDIEMPVMNGLEALREIIQRNPKPVIMMSVLTQHGAEATFKALEYGAVDFIPKPSNSLSLSVDEISFLLIEKVKSVYNYQLKIPSRDLDNEKEVEVKVEEETTEPVITDVKHDSTKVVAIGTSTGGPAALVKVFKDIPEKFPSPVLVVQHMPEGFTTAFAKRLNSNSALDVKEAEDGDKLLPGCGYIAPGDSHMEITNNKNGRVVRIYQKEKVSGHRPSIDVLFNSVAKTYGKDSVCVIMTGMGRDGAEGILKVKKKGGYTISQDESTSVVYGMNKVAVEKGAIDDIVTLSKIPQKIVEHL